MSKGRDCGRNTFLRYWNRNNTRSHNRKRWFAL